MVQQTASGTNRDKQGKSFVDSPTRGDNYTAQEVYVGNQSSDPIPVEVTSSGETQAEYSELLVSALSTQTLIDLTITPGKAGKLRRLECSGENVGSFVVEKNASTIGKTRLYFTNYNSFLDLRELSVTAGDNIKILVENKRNTNCNFNATLIYNEFDL